MGRVARKLADIVGDLKLFIIVEYGKLPVFAESFLRIARKKLRVHVTVVFAERILCWEPS